MIELADAIGFTLPSTDPDELRRYMVVDDATDLEEFLKRFDLTIPLLQTLGVDRAGGLRNGGGCRRDDNLRYPRLFATAPKLSTRAGSNSTK
ncbi:MAG: hypothetical protein R2882_10415 [Gemmatimonadales bacterium]